MTVDTASSQIIECLLAQRSELERLRERRLLVCAGEPGWSRHCAQLLAAHWRSGALLWLGERAPEYLTPVRQSDYRHHLGREYELIVIDAHAGLDVDALAAVAGTLRGGGILLLMTPELDDWAGQRDTELERFTGEPATEPSRFLQRLIHHLDHKAVWLLEQSRGLRQSVVVSGDEAVHATEDAAAQSHVIGLIEAAGLSRHTHRPLVISAPRGRGKSAALGMAAARILQRSDNTLVVTAPRRENCDVLFRHARTAVATEGPGWDLSFVPPDELLRRRPPADLLLIDEAAAIPLPLLERIVQIWPRVVLATTLHGYEGTGRGFELKFFPRLDQFAPGWTLLRMQAPVRWSESDPLEDWLTRTLLLDADLPPIERLPAFDAGAVSYTCLSQQGLLDDGQALAQVFGLLISAHYRTRPSDLRQLLDAPGLSIHVLRQQHQVLAAALVVREGDIDAELIPRIFCGQRRVRGHLIPQSLVAHAGWEMAGRLRYARIMRIAVHPQLQKHGLGSRLLEAIGHSDAVQGADFLGASFGVDPPLLRFWQRNGYTPVRVGLKREASSGMHAAIVLKAVSNQAPRMLEGLNAHFAELLSLQLAHSLDDLAPEVVTALLQPGVGAGTGSVRSGMNDRDWSELIAFAFAQRGFETSLVAIQRWFGMREAAVLRLSTLAETERGFLLEKLLRHRDWHGLARDYGLSGRKAAIEQLRSILRRLLSAFDSKAVQVHRRRLSV